MHYGNIKLNDIANGEGVRISLFVSGCTNHCKECFNPETWNFEYGKPFTKETEQFILDNLKSDFVNGLTLLGGEPFEPKNQKVLLPFVKKVKEIYPNKTIWAYSGFRLDDELLNPKAYLPHLPEEALCRLPLSSAPFVCKLKDRQALLRRRLKERRSWLHLMLSRQGHFYV